MKVENSVTNTWKWMAEKKDDDIAKIYIGQETGEYHDLPGPVEINSKTIVCSIIYLFLILVGLE